MHIPSRKYKFHLKKLNKRERAIRSKRTGKEISNVDFLANKEE